MFAPAMWIMKITPNEPWRTEEIFDCLFLNNNPRNVIGWAKENEKGAYHRFMKYWNEMKIGDVVIIMKGMSITIGCVIITSDPYSEDYIDDCEWFIYKRKAKLLKKFNPHVEHEKATNRDTIIGSYGSGASHIMEEVWNIVKNDYKEEVKKLMYDLVKNKIDKFRLILNLKNQLILAGPPGTGKTYTAKQLAISQASGQIFTKDLEKKFEEWKDNHQIEIVQFHPSYNYEDFVRGIQVSTNENKITYATQNRILGDMAQKALNSKENKEEKKYVLIIDEINRANLAAVLGELIYALEYRGEKVRTPYSVNDDYEITIPDSLYIIGTMNTADRSVGYIDYAVRRRFAFVPCLPDSSVLETYYADSNNSYLKDTALELFDTVAALFSKTGTGDNQHNQGYLAPDFFKDDVQVGHTYFMAKDCEELAMKFAYQVYPLLREYYKDGILVSGNEKIEIKIDQEQNGGHPLRLDNPEDCQAIFDRIVRKCQEKEKSARGNSTQSEENNPNSQDSMSQEDSGQESDSQ